MRRPGAVDGGTATAGPEPVTDRTEPATHAPADTAAHRHL